MKPYKRIFTIVIDSMASETGRMGERFDDLGVRHPWGISTTICRNLTSPIWRAGYRQASPCSNT